MNRYLSSGLVLLLVVAFLSGCAKDQIDRQERQAQTSDACKASFVNPAGDAKVATVSIPISKEPNGPAIKIGEVTYTHAEAQKLAAAAQVAEQSRLAVCQITSHEVLEKLDGAQTIEALKLSAQIMGVKDELDKAVAAASTPAQAVAAAEQVKTKADELRKQADKLATQAGVDLKVTSNTKPDGDKKPSTDTKTGGDTGVGGDAKPGDIKQGSNLDLNRSLRSSDLVDGPSEWSNQYKKIADSLDSLSKEVAALRHNPLSAEIRVTGYEKNALDVPPRERERLFTEVQNALSQIPKSQRAVILAVGYADKSGSYLRNFDLAFRRAQAVLAYLQEQNLPYSYEGRASSGGIDGTPKARRVEVFVTGT